MTTQTITKNPSGDLCQHGAYADLCITCHPANGADGLPTDWDDRRRAIWHLENALDALQHPEGIPAETILSALVCAARLDRILFPESAD